jgi:hypothetical protein
LLSTGYLEAGEVVTVQKEDGLGSLTNPVLRLFGSAA